MKMSGRAIRNLSRRAKDEQGSSLVEMALVSVFVFFPLLFGIIEFSYAWYAYNWVNMAARQATRFAVVRGTESCIIAAAPPNSKTFFDCNLGPETAKNTTPPSAITTYVQALAYPGIHTDSTSNQLTVTATWLTKSVTTGSGGFSTTTWTTACTSTATNQPACNFPGNAVQVVVTYALPLNLPFWKNISLNLNATSQMVINE